MLLPNKIARFFDYQYLWKESNDILGFLHGDSHHRKVVTEAVTFDLVCQVSRLSKLHSKVGGIPEGEMGNFSVGDFFIRWRESEEK